MNIGDSVVHVSSVGTIVGVSKSGNPIVEWTDESTFDDFAPEELLVVDLTLPQLPEELRPDVQE